MSFPKAKTKRFNEFMSCAPPVGSYDPKTSEKVSAAIMDSKDERFKEPRPVDSHAPNFLSSTVLNSHSFQASTPRKLSAASSVESLASDRSSVSGIPKRAPSVSNLMAPVDLAKQKDLERQIRLLVNERNELHRRVLLREEELQKVDSRLQGALKDQTSMIATLAAKEKELSDLKKGNEILKTKVQDVNVDRLRQLQAEITHLQDKLKKKEKEVTDMHDRLKRETDEKNSSISALTQTNSKLAEANKELMKEIDDKSRQLRLLVGNGRAYEAEMDLLKKDISKLKSRNQRFVEGEATLVEQCDRVQLVFSHCLDIQKQIENLVESVNQQGTDSSSTDTSEDLRVWLNSDVSLLRASVEQEQKMDVETLAGDLKLKVHELVDAAVADVSALESVHQDLLSLFSKLIQCQQNEGALEQSISMLNEKIKEHQENLNNITESKKDLQKLYEEALESVKAEKEQFENIQLTASGLQSEKTSLEMELRQEKELSLSLQEKLRVTDAKISQLNEIILSTEKLISCSTDDKEDLLHKNLKLESELRTATGDRDRLEDELKQFGKECGELNDVIQQKDLTYIQLEEERNELATKLETTMQSLAEASQQLSEAREKVRKMEEERDKMMLEIEACEVAEAAKTAELKQAVKQLEELKQRTAETKEQLEELEQRATETKEQLEEERNELATKLGTTVQSLAEASQQLSEAREQVRKMEEEHDKMMLEMKTCQNSEAVKAAELKQAANQLEELEQRAAETKEQLEELKQRALETKEQLEEERNELATKLEATVQSLAEANLQLSEAKEQVLKMKEERDKMMLEIEACEVAEAAKAAELKQAAKQLEELEQRAAETKEELEEERNELATKLQATVQSLAEASQQFSEAREQVLKLEDGHDKMMLEMKTCEEAAAVTAAELTQVVKQLEELKQRAAETKEELDQVLSERDRLSEDFQTVKTDLERERSQSAEYEERLTRHKQDSEQLREQLSLDAERIISLEKMQDLLRDEMAKKCNDLEETLGILSQGKAELEYSVKTLETELSRSQDSLRSAEQRLHERESAYLLLSGELDSVKAEREEAENLVSRLQGEVQTVRLQTEQTEFARIELEVAKSYMETDLSEVNEKLKEALEEVEKAQRQSEEVESTNRQLNEDKTKSLVRIQGLEEVIAQLNGFLVDANNAATGKEEALQSSQKENNDLTRMLEQQRTEIHELRQVHGESEDKIHTLTMLLDNSTSTLQTKTRELQAATGEIESLRMRVNEAEEMAVGLEAERARHAVERQELAQSLLVLRKNSDAAAEHMSCELNRVQEQMMSLRQKNEELEQSHQTALKSFSDERFQLSSQVEMLSEKEKHLELEVLKCHDRIKRRNAELETMSVQIKDLKQSALLVEKLKERCRLLETNSAQESEHLRQRLDEERRRVEMERQRQQMMQQDYRCNSERLQMQLETKTRELNEASDIIRRLQKTQDQYSEQLSEMSHRHQEEVADLKRTLEEKSQQNGDVTRIAEESRRWREMYEELWNKVQPFKEQLEAFEMEKQLLLGRSKNAQMEIEKLSHDYAKVLGHQNQKQKIHHILKLKEENVTLKKEVEMLRDKDCKQKRKIEQLNEKLDALEGKRRFDPSKAFKPSRENDSSTVQPLREGNR